MVNFSAIASGIKQGFQYPIGTYLNSLPQVDKYGRTTSPQISLEEAHPHFQEEVSELKSGIKKFITDIVPIPNWLNEIISTVASSTLKRTPAELLGGLVGLGGIGAFIAGTSPGAWIYEKATGVMDWVYEKARPLLQWGGAIVGGAGIIAGLSSLAIFKKSLAPEKAPTADK